MESSVEDRETRAPFHRDHQLYTTDHWSVDYLYISNLHVNCYQLFRNSVVEIQYMSFPTT